jgi:hypothetical protein
MTCQKEKLNFPSCVLKVVPGAMMSHYTALYRQVEHEISEKNYYSCERDKK